jgi:hypothetical protein
VTALQRLQAERDAAAEGARLLDDVAAFLATYVAFPSEHAKVATTLWSAHCHALDCFDSTPRWAGLSPEPGSGKTRTLEALELLVPNPMHALNASAPPLFRSIEKQRPVLLMDEVDGLFGRHGKDDDAKDVRALVNAGHRRGATIPRCVGPTHNVEQFPVFCAVALAGLGDLPDTLMTRSVVVRMRRRAPGEYVRPFRYRDAKENGHALRDRLAAWTVNADELLRRYPSMPSGVTDRPADVWEPLLAVADAAAGHWPDTARTACVEMVKVVASGEASLGIRLLTDLRTVFRDADRMSTEAILKALCDLDEAPWSDLRGRPLDPRGLDRRLGAYGIHSTKVKIGGDSLRGYQRDDLWDPWTRYLPSPDPVGAEPAEPAEQPCSEAPSTVPLAIEVPEPVCQAEPGAPPLTCPVPEVPQVPDFRGRDPLGRVPCSVCGRPTERVGADGRPRHGVCEASA